MLAALFWGLRYCHRQYAQRRVYVLPPTAVARIRRAFLGVALLPQAIRATARLCAPAYGGCAHTPRFRGAPQLCVIERRNKDIPQTLGVDNRRRILRRLLDIALI